MSHIIIDDMTVLIMSFNGPFVELNFFYYISDKIMGNEKIILRKIANWNHRFQSRNYK
jgi:hypothetical protein